MNLNTHLNQALLTILIQSFFTFCFADFYNPTPENPNSNTESPSVGESKNILDILYPNRASWKPAAKAKHLNYRSLGYPSLQRDSLQTFQQSQNYDQQPRYNDLTAGNIEAAISDQTAVETNRQAVFNHPAVINNLNILKTIFGKLKGQHDNFKLEQEDRFEDRSNENLGSSRSVHLKNNPGAFFPSSREGLHPFLQSIKSHANQKNNDEPLYFDDFTYPLEIPYNNFKNLYLNKFRSDNASNGPDSSDEQNTGLSITNNMDILRDRLLKAIKRRRQGRQHTLPTRNSNSGGLGALG